MYIGGDAETKISNYQFLKSAYALRSKYLHGQELERKHNTYLQQKTISQKLDELLRSILNKVIFEDSAIFKKKEDELRKWFQELIFH